MNTLSLSKDEAIRRISQLDGTYDPDSSLSIWDQLSACESLHESTPIKEHTTLEEKKTDEDGNGMRCNGSYKRSANTLLSQTKHDAIAQLKLCNYRTNPAKTSALLEDIFSDYRSDEGYWFSVAQRWPPRRINQVMNYLIKLESPDHVTVRNPAAYFTFLIRRRVERKSNKY